MLPRGCASYWSRIRRSISITFAAS
jgi:hypothetical protein